MSKENNINRAGNYFIHFNTGIISENNITADKYQEGIITGKNKEELKTQLIEFIDKHFGE